MGIPPDQARRLTYWEFTAMRWGWEQRHKIDGDDGEPAEIPSEDFVRDAQRELLEMGAAGSKH